jgi:hypothetical protein
LATLLNCFHDKKTNACVASGPVKITWPNVFFPNEIRPGLTSIQDMLMSAMLPLVLEKINLCFALPASYYSFLELAHIKLGCVSVVKQGYEYAVLETIFCRKSIA